MTGALVALVVLYAIWRIAVVAGRRLERRRRSSFPFAPGERALAPCERCGRPAGEDELAWRGVGPWRRLVCREGCPPRPTEAGDDLEG